MSLFGRIEFPNLISGEIKIDRVAFTLFGTQVYWYGIIITAAVALGVAYALKNAVRVGVVPDNVFDVAFWGIVGGIVGARAYYVIFWNLDHETTYKYTLKTAITGIRDGGLAIYGGLIGAVIAGLLSARLLKIKFAPIMDLAGIGFMIGHAIGRWGNFVNQEAFGSVTTLPWGMTGDRIAEQLGYMGEDAFALVHPCFLYESLWCLAGFFFLRFYLKKLRVFDGELFLVYVMWYGAGRAFIEQLRTDSLMAGGLKVSQVLSIAGAIFAAVLLVRFKRKGKLTAYKDTDESKAEIAKYQLNVKLEKEKAAAIKALRQTRSELASPKAESILVKEEEDSGGENS